MVTQDLPTGTLTFLFTDIEGSTRLWEKAPQETSRAMARHDQIVQQTIAAHHGFLHRARGEGDSEFAVFQSALDAVTAAALIQQHFFAEPWETPRPLKIRIALHTGESDLRLGDYYGPEVNRTARLRSIAYGGQVLLSGATFSLVQGALPDGVSVQDKGEHRLKDLVRPEHVYQLVISGLPCEFPPLKSIKTSLTNIPAQTTPFVGRQEEAAHLQALLAQEEIRLVTLIAPGGTGKTRLAIEVAAQQLPHFRDGVFFVPLAPLGDAGHIVQAIIEAASISLTSGDDLQAQLLRYLRRKQMLLVLDNFEHLLDGARLLNDILAAAPHVTILATSRERLNLSGETLLVMEGLQVNEWRTPQEVLAQSAGQLFVQSVQRIQPGFHLDKADVPHITRICRLVEGMPLPILLAASWADMLSPAEIAAEIENSLDFLETELRDIPARQRSIRAVFEGSWEKLASAERELFKRLSVFRGGFTREAAAQVADASLRSLARLVNKSFLTHDPAAGRYAVHELLRQYAAERLQAQPAAAISVQEAHTTYFAGLMAKMWQPLRTDRQRAALDETEADIENVRVAWRRLANRGAAHEMGRMIQPLWYFHELRCWYHVGLELFTTAEELLSAAPGGAESELLNARIQGIKGFYTTLLGSPQRGEEMARGSLATLRRLGCREERLLSLVALSVSYLFLNRGADAVLAAEESLQVAAEVADPWWLALCSTVLGSASMTAQAFVDARRYAAQAATAWEQIGDAWGATFPGTVLAGLALRATKYVEARKRYEFVLEKALSINFKRGLQYTYSNLGHISFWLEDYQEAEDYYLQSMVISDETGQTREMVAALFDIARVRAAAGSTREAVELLPVILQHPARFQHTLFRHATIEEDAQKLRGQLENELDPTSYEAAWQSGLQRELQHAVDEVLSEST